MADNNDCPSCQDLPGTPVPGQEDVYAFAMPMPPDDQLTPWHAMQPATRPKPHASAWGSSPAASAADTAASQPSWPDGLFDYDAAPDPGAADTMARIEYLPPLDAPWGQWPIQQQVSPPNAMNGVIQDADDTSITYLPPHGAPWNQRSAASLFPLENTSDVSGVVASLHHFTPSENALLEFHEALLTGMDFEPGEMTPEQRKEWEALLRRMKEEVAERKREEAEKQRREEERVAYEKRLEELAARRRERLARRTPEEIEYDEALERWNKARQEVVAKWRECQDEVARQRKLCLERANTDWEDCRDEEAQTAIVCSLACAAFGGVAAKLCIGACIANWVRARMKCDEKHDRAKRRCEEDYDIASEKCAKTFREDRKKAAEANPVPPKPDSHDY